MNKYQKTSPPLINTTKKTQNFIPFEQDELDEYKNNNDLPITTTKKSNPRYITRSTRHLIQKIEKIQDDDPITQLTSIRSEELTFHNGVMEEYNLPILDRHPSKALQTNHLNAVYDPTSQMYLEYRKLIQTNASKIWKKAFAKEIGRLAQGYKETKGTDTIFFIPKAKIP